MELKGLSLPRLEQKRPARYLMEDADGWAVSVPEDKLEAWTRADHKAPLNSSERRALDRLRQKLLGSGR